MLSLPLSKTIDEACLMYLVEKYMKFHPGAIQSKHPNTWKSISKVMNDSDWNNIQLAYAILCGDFVDKLELERKFIVSICHKAL